MIGSLTGLLELWCDCNRITTLPPVSALYIVQLKLAHTISEVILQFILHGILWFIFKGIGNLKQLMFLDASKNRIEYLPGEIDGCVSLADLHLSTNLLQQFTENIGTYLPHEFPNVLRGITCVIILQKSSQVLQISVIPCCVTFQVA